MSRLDPEIVAAFLRCTEAERGRRHSSLDDYQPPRDLKPLASFPITPEAPEPEAEAEP